MKLIRIIIALSSIYVFLGVIFFCILGFIWISRFTPNFPTNTVAQVNTGTQGNPRIEFSEIESASTINTMISRDKEMEPKIKQIYLIESPVLFATYEKVIVNDSLVPLGFTQLFRLSTVKDAEGKRIDTIKRDWVDYIFALMLPYIGELQQESLSLLARPQATSYTVSISTDGINYHEN